MALTPKEIAEVVKLTERRARLEAQIKSDVEDAAKLKGKEYDEFKKYIAAKRDELKLQLKEYEQNGIEVDVTMYHPVTQQTDATPDILADGTRIKITKASEYKFIAVSRNLLKRWGGALNFGDFVLLRGTKDGRKDGVYQVRDVMNARFVNRIDVLESPGAPPYKFTDANIVKLDWVSTNN